MTLAELGKDRHAVVGEITGGGIGCRRMADLGITRGAGVIVRGTAPLGDPIIIEVNDCAIAIRKTDARNVKVTI